MRGCASAGLNGLCISRAASHLPPRPPALLHSHTHARAQGINAYGVTRHRHMPEIEQGLTDAAGAPVRVSFTPHLMPMNRGMETACYVKMAPGVTVADLRKCLEVGWHLSLSVGVGGWGRTPVRSTCALTVW